MTSPEDFPLPVASRPSRSGAGVPTSDSHALVVELDASMVEELEAVIAWLDEHGRDAAAEALRSMMRETEEPVDVTVAQFHEFAHMVKDAKRKLGLPADRVAGRADRRRVEAEVGREIRRRLVIRAAPALAPRRHDSSRGPRSRRLVRRARARSPGRRTSAEDGDPEPPPDLGVIPLRQFLRDVLAWLRVTA